MYNIIPINPANADRSERWEKEGGEEEGGEEERMRWEEEGGEAR